MRCRGQGPTQLGSNGVQRVQLRRAEDLPSTLELSRSPETEEPSPGTPLQKENRVPLSARLPGAKQRVKDLRLASHLDLVRAGLGPSRRLADVEAMS